MILPRFFIFILFVSNLKTKKKKSWKRQKNNPERQKMQINPLRWLANKLNDKKDR
jgi:hypothetical protein